MLRSYPVSGFALCFLLLVLGACGLGQEQAEPSPVLQASPQSELVSESDLDQPYPQPNYVARYASDHGLSLEEANRRLWLMHDFQQITEQIRAQEANSLRGIIHDQEALRFELSLPEGRSFDRYQSYFSDPKWQGLISFSYYEPEPTLPPAAIRTVPVAPTFNPYPDPQQNRIIASYAQSYNLSYAEAERRLNMQNEFARRISQLESSPNYLGSKIIHEPQFFFRIALSRAEEPFVMADYFPEAEWQGLIELRESDLSKSAFQALVDQIEPILNSGAYRLSLGVDEVEQKVVVFPHEEGLEERLRALEELRPYWDYLQFEPLSPEIAPAQP
jgi:hypothetical protein